ncbi:uncharacterized protein LOC134528239 [Bacillus rossius redtenbacheri]|uniref:uncharacterized protein LOC134528239 n=1 Tax=Bacillus rossius redtenbacheri TaxID=93214 RepID=UPI002FDD2E44
MSAADLVAWKSAGHDFPCAFLASSSDGADGCRLAVSPGTTPGHAPHALSAGGSGPLPHTCYNLLFAAAVVLSCGKATADGISTQSSDPLVEHCFVACTWCFYSTAVAYLLVPLLRGRQVTGRVFARLAEVDRLLVKQPVTLYRRMIIVQALVITVTFATCEPNKCWAALSQRESRSLLFYSCLLLRV